MKRIALCRTTLAQACDLFDKSGLTLDEIGWVMATLRESFADACVEDAAGEYLSQLESKS